MNIKSLLTAFMDTSRVHPGSRAVMQAYMKGIIKLCASGALPFDRNEFETFFKEMETRDFPAVHHSAAYREHYHPAYRLVAVELLETA